MDSKLVVEQMSRQLEDQAPRHAAAGAGGQPAGAVRDDVHLGAARAEQARRPARQRGARRQRSGVTVAGPTSPTPDSPIEEVESPSATARPATPAARLVGAGGPADHARPGAPRRHRAHASRSASPAAWPAPTPGSATRAAPRSRATADWLAPLAERVDAVVTSPVRRTRESAEILAERLGRPLASRSRASPRWSSAPGTG